MQYKISYLTDGTKVKITNQLFNQIKIWETDQIDISSVLLDELKIQDNEWINNTRNYYLNTVAMNSLPYRVLNEEKSLRINNFQQRISNKILLECVMRNLEQCTSIQKRRFLLHYYYGLSYTEIADIEGKSKIAVRESVKKATNLLINSEQFRKHPNK